MKDLIAETIETAKRKGIDLCNKKKICISLDVNGPLTATNSAALEPYPGIIEAIKELDKLGVYIIINSAWDIYTSKLFDKNRLGEVADGFIGENGAIYALRDNESVIMADVDLEELRLNLFISVLRSCSEENYSLASQGNQINASYYHEFERGLVENISRENIIRPGMNDFLRTLKQYGVNSKIRRNEVLIEESMENYKQLQNIFGKDYKLISFRPKITDGQIRLEVNEYHDKNISLINLDIMAKKVVKSLENWVHYRINDDFCIDYSFSTNISNNEFNKASALNALIEDMCKIESFDREDLLIMGIGDGGPDTCIRNLGDSIFFGIYGTKSENDCDMATSSGLEFLQIVKKISDLIAR